jgi:hypothetical protein
VTDRRINPTRHLYQGAPYVNAANTDIRVRFKAWQQEQAKPAQAANVKPIKKAKTA